jgi:uncharacterized protein YaaR (DUF327 family)
LGQDYNDMMKKITSGLKMPEFPKIKIEVPKTDALSTARFIPPTAGLKRALDGMNREREEKIQREKETVEFLRSLYELAKENPAQVQQHFQTLVQNSGTIHNMQNVHSGSTGIQNITNNTGIQADEMMRLLDSMRELSDILAPDRAEEAQDLIDDLQQEVQKPEGEVKKGRIKASLRYLKSLFTEVIAEPAKNIAKAQFTEYAKEKAPEIIESIGDVLDNLG